MHPRLFPPPRLLQFAGVIIFLVSLPKSYSRCDRTFNCGSVTGIGYPFWGNGRPDYCGIPEFELKCLQDGSSEMEIMSQTYRVLGIDQSQRIIRIVRLDLWDGACPEQLLNTTLNFTFFHYAAGNVNLTLFYGCSSPNSSSPSSSLMEIRATNQFSCPVRGAANEAISDAYVVISGSTLSVRKQNTPSCNQSIIVPVLETADGRFGSHGVILGALLRRGFNVQHAAYDTMCSQCVDSGGRCGYNSKPTCFCRNPPYLLLPPDPLTCASSILGFFTIVGVMLLLYYLRKKFSTGSSMGFWKRRTKNAQNMEAFLNTFGSLAPKKYSYIEIKKMTNSFKHKLGQGGYGGVFKGILLDGSMVAVKVSTETKGNGEEFINEVASICRTSHVNIERLLGFCFDGSKRALIYEFMPNGSLEKFIHMEKPLTHPHLGWERLYQIAVGIAQGLEYLHRGCSTRILHFDIKPHNILLDQDFCPKISDFGLAKLCPRKESIISMAGARGTAGYIAPEVFCRNFGGVSHKSDVYSYGMMILEMVGGRKNIDVGVGNTSEIYFPHWIYKRLELDEDLRLHGVITSEEEEIARKMILVGLWCIQTDPSNRPSMSKVVDMLEGSLESLEIPPKPFLSPPPRSPVQSSITSMSQKQCI